MTDILWILLLVPVHGNPITLKGNNKILVLRQ